jgi:hypothetical protein
VKELVVEQSLNERVGVLSQFRIRGLGQHQGSQGPDGVGV